MSFLFSFDGLTKRFGDLTAVDTLSLHAEHGEIIGLIGANGSGKTTTMRMLLGLIRPTSGTACIRGIDSSNPSTRTGVGYLPDDPPLEDRWTIRTQLDWWEQLRGPATLRTELEDRLGIDRRKRIRDLSRGNRQKAAVVLALMHDPELVVMDEPATGLDPLVRQELWAVLRGHAARGRTVLLSSHVLADVEQACDRVVVLRDGRRVFDGQVQELLRQATRTVHIEFRDPVDPSAFDSLATVDLVQSDGRNVNLSIVGALDPVVKAAAAYEVVDFSASKPTLEGSFADLNAVSA